MCPERWGERRPGAEDLNGTLQQAAAARMVLPPVFFVQDPAERGSERREVFLDGLPQPFGINVEIRMDQHVPGPDYRSPRYLGGGHPDLLGHVLRCLADDLQQSADGRDLLLVLEKPAPVETGREEKRLLKSPPRACPRGTP